MICGESCKASSRVILQKLDPLIGVRCFALMKVMAISFLSLCRSSWSEPFCNPRGFHEVAVTIQQRKKISTASTQD